VVAHHIVQLGESFVYLLHLLLGCEELVCCTGHGRVFFMKANTIPVDCITEVNHTSTLMLLVYLLQERDKVIVHGWGMRAAKDENWFCAHDIYAIRFLLVAR
jgi:hypothetical protein